MSSPALEIRRNWGQSGGINLHLTKHSKIQSDGGSVIFNLCLHRWPGNYYPARKVEMSMEDFAWKIYKAQSWELQILLTCILTLDHMTAQNFKKKKIVKCRLSVGPRRRNGFWFQVTVTTRATLYFFWNPVVGSKWPSATKWTFSVTGLKEEKVWK